LARINNAYTHPTAPGMDGLGELGWAILKIGTNDTRWGASITPANQTSYTNLITAMLARAANVIVMAVPPCGPNANGASGAGVNSFNIWLAAHCAGRANVHFINDTATVGTGTGEWAAAYMPTDGIHYGAKAKHRMSIDGAAAFAAIVNPFGYPSPISLDATDVYPAQPQWVTNHRMTGGGGATMPTGWSVTHHAYSAVYTKEVVAADVGDVNQAPWIRVTPTACSASTADFIKVACTLSGRAVTTVDPVMLEMMAEIRFNNFSGTKWTEFRAGVYGNNNEYVAQRIRLTLGDQDNINGVYVLRSAEPRLMAGAKAHASVSLNWELHPQGNFTDATGSFDIRCTTVRG
jgi:hypothetical protein